MEIKFSGMYPKLHNQISAELVAVRDIRIDKNTPQALLEYDTLKSDGSYYNLRTGNYIQLVFVGNLGIPFCTIRTKTTPWGSDKKEYYEKYIGSVFEITIIPDEE